MIKWNHAILAGLVWLAGFSPVSYAQLIEGKDGTLPILNIPMLWVPAGGYDTRQLALNEYIPDTSADLYKGAANKPDEYREIALSPKFSQGFWISKEPITFDDYFRFLNAIAASGRAPDDRAFPAWNAWGEFPREKGYDIIFYDNKMQVVSKDATKAQFVLKDAYRGKPVAFLNFEDTQLFVQWLQLLFGACNGIPESLQAEIPNLYEFGYAFLKRPEIADNQGPRLTEWCGMGNYQAMSGVKDFVGQFQQMQKDGTVDELILKKTEDRGWQATINPASAIVDGGSANFHIIIYSNKNYTLRANQ